MKRESRFPAAIAAITLVAATMLTAVSATTSSNDDWRGNSAPASVLSAHTHLT